jgi:hypothetical protein
MPLTPQITLTATLQDVSGAAAGSVANPAVLRIALAGYGLTLPCIVGTANLARVGPEDFYDTGSGVSVQLWGNDVINPLGTYYAITLLDGDGNILQCGSYQFSGTQTIDLSSAAQIVPNSTLVYVTCAGDYPGTVYTAPGPVVAVSYNGTLQRPGIDYSLSNGNKQINLTFSTTDAEGENISAICTVIVASSLTPGASLLQYVVCAGAIPGAAGTVYTAPGKIVAAAYNGALQGSTFYTLLSADTFEFNFPTFEGDTVYALCF